jgi:hypothetical protein
MQHDYISATIETSELIRIHADKAHPLFIQRIEELQDVESEKEKLEETTGEMWSTLDSAEKAADELAEILDYAADGSGHHRGTDYFESLRASKKKDREECLAEFIEDLRNKLGDIYAHLKQGKDL